jgi:hypothetical protein
MDHIWPELPDNPLKIKQKVSSIHQPRRTFPPTPQDLLHPLRQWAVFSPQVPPFETQSLYIQSGRDHR